MATSRKRAFAPFDPKEFYKSFPKLDAANHKPTSPPTPPQIYPQRPYTIYNCFAFVVGDKKKFWWPGGCGYWPRNPSAETVEEIMDVLETEFGYEPCNDGAYEPGVHKVAIFVNEGVPVHIAFQHGGRGGIWSSKMGYEIDMEHDLNAIDSEGCDPKCEGYGKAEKFMRRSIRRKKAKTGRNQLVLDFDKNG